MNTIFVSSTFQDMQQERDVLQNSVLPRIKELAKQKQANAAMHNNTVLFSMKLPEKKTGITIMKFLIQCFMRISLIKPFALSITSSE